MPANKGVFLWFNLTTNKIPSYFCGIINAIVKNENLNLIVKQIDIDFQKYKNQKTEILKKLIQKINQGNYSYLLLSCWYYNFPFIIEFIKALREKNKKIKIILGGIVIENSYNQVKEFLSKEINLFFNKKNDYSNLLNLLKKLNKKKPIKNTKIITKDIKNNNLNFKNLPCPDFSFKGKSHKELLLKTAQGCNYGKCKFCTSDKVKHNAKDINSIENEIKEYKNKYDTKHIKIIDNNFIFNKKRSIKISEIFKKHNLTWDCYARLENTTDKKFIETLIENNLKGIFVGFDTSDKKNFIKYKKADTTFQDHKNNLKKLLKNLNEIKKKIHLEIGLIDFDNKKIIFENLESKHIKIHKSKLVYLPGSLQYTREPSKFEWDNNKNFFYNKFYKNLFKFKNIKNLNENEFNILKNKHHICKVKNIENFMKIIEILKIINKYIKIPKINNNEILKFKNEYLITHNKEKITGNKINEIETKKIIKNINEELIKKKENLFYQFENKNITLNKIKNIIKKDNSLFLEKISDIEIENEK